MRLPLERADWALLTAYLLAAALGGMARAVQRPLR